MQLLFTCSRLPFYKQLPANKTRVGVRGRTTPLSSTPLLSTSISHFLSHINSLTVHHPLFSLISLLFLFLSPLSLASLFLLFWVTTKPQPTTITPQHDRGSIRSKTTIVVRTVQSEGMNGTGSLPPDSMST